MADEHGHEGGGFLHKKLFGLPLPVVLGGGALVVFFVLAHRSAGGGVSAPAAGPTGPTGDTTGQGTAMSLQDQLTAEQLGYQTALDKLNLQAAQFGLNQAEQGAAAFGSPGSPVAQGTQGGHTVFSYGTGQVSKAWQQIGNGQWEDIFHPGHIISDQQAQQLAPEDHGPYASGANKLTLGNFFAPVLKGLQQAANVYVGTQLGIPVGLPNAPSPVSAKPAPQSAPATPSYTPPVLVASKNRGLQ